MSLCPPKFWILVSEQTGMPVEVQKCAFEPTVGRQGCRWRRAFLQGELTELEQLEAQIKGYMETLRPLLEKWETLRK